MQFQELRGSVGKREYPQLKKWEGSVTHQVNEKPAISVVPAITTWAGIGTATSLIVACGMWASVFFYQQPGAMINAASSADAPQLAASIEQ